ncbi:hypothetical protein GGR20_002374 [Devosia subaequoris]|uniref:Uncharacterized protein n=1 Tax=Devosia subaequoris TaxID=395930 RepID=A0A7W6IN88_9HYPH|nr:hypothetical protein [Devosia subaequoris]MBB4052726.1 hypothetical protein [Devosia subaequoris]MCP1209879.1 hypothetical protein [Devosia subaequoris]
MADYKELLRRAISALPENNGAARRAVYEKARSALVGQLRAIQPPLPARDITQHRLQLEDCIRQVEQEASEAVISLGRDGPLAARPAAPQPRPEPVAPPEPVETEAEDEPEAVSEPEPDPLAAVEREAEPEETDAPSPEDVAAALDAVAPVAEPAPEPIAGAAEEPPVATEPAEESEPNPASGKFPSIEDIIAQAAETGGATVSRNPDTVRDDTGPATEETGPPVEPERPGKTFSFARRDAVTSETAGKGNTITPASLAPRIEPVMGSTALASQPANAEPVLIDPPLPVDPALSSVREVEVEQDDARAAEGAIERAIETLDREARGEATPSQAHQTETGSPPSEAVPESDTSFAPVDAERRTGTGLTIFLIVFALLLAGVGGAGFWAWREGYVDLDQMFGRSQTSVVQPETIEQPTGLTMDNTTTEPVSAEESASGPGNTATTSATEPTSALEAGDEERLEPTLEPVTPTGTETVLPSLGSDEVKTEERLSGEDTTIAATEDPAASVDPVDLAGNQSLLLEASTGGQASTVPFSGTVEWSQGTDEIGQPTLVAEASIPARNMSVSILIRRNIDPSLPASHLMEISFDIPDTFIGGSIATLAGVLLKNEELVPGTALAGAAARIVGNTFLFALSAAPDDLTANTDLLDTQRWIDLAIVYGTGRNAILTLEKDEEAQALFDTVLAAWEE